MLEELSGELSRLEAAGLRRELRVHDLATGHSFAGNDYLGLAAHPRVRAAAARAAIEEAAGSGGSRLVGGTTDSVLHLEAELAQYFRGPGGLGSGESGGAGVRALVFSSGYHASLGVICSLAGRGDVIFCDRLIHASLIDAVRLSGAKLVRFRHNETSDLERLLESTTGRRRLIVTEGLFSMDGDIAPLSGIFDMAAAHDCQVVVDDAHGAGTLGAGRGAVAELGLQDHPFAASGNLVIIGTLSKALGSLGGLVLAHPIVIDYLVNSARTFIFTTALPPSVVAAARASVSILDSSEGIGLLADLRANALLMRKALRARDIECAGDDISPIIPVVVGDSDSTMRLGRSLLSAGFHVGAIRPPAVEARKARLRITVSAMQKSEHIEALTGALASALSNEGIPVTV